MTNVETKSNPICFGQEFQGQIANPRDVIFHHTKRVTGHLRNKGAKNNEIDGPELSIDDPELKTNEKLARVRVETLVREYLANQEVQLLGEVSMSDVNQTYQHVVKDDLHAISS